MICQMACLENVAIKSITEKEEESNYTHGKKSQ